MLRKIHLTANYTEKCIQINNRCASLCCILLRVRCGKKVTFRNIR
jgi:hypothetical protein